MPEFMQFKIPERMPKKIIPIAELLNKLKISPDPDYSTKDRVVASIGTESMVLMLKKTGSLIGGLEDKRILDVACGPTINYQSVFVGAIKEMGIGTHGYMGWDPEAMGGSCCGEFRYISQSFFLQDPEFVGKIGKFDLVFSANFFGSPISAFGFNVMEKTLDCMLQMKPEELITRKLYIYLGGFFKNAQKNKLFESFVQFLAQERCRIMLANGGKVVHFVLRGEPAPDLKVAEAAGLELVTHDTVQHTGGHFMGELLVFKAAE